LVARTPFEVAVIDRRVRTSVEGMTLWVARADDLIVYQLVAGRSRDFADAEEVALAIHARRRSRYRAPRPSVARPSFAASAILR
jgi:hypothetical protein